MLISIGEKLRFGTRLRDPMMDLLNELLRHVRRGYQLILMIDFLESIESEIG
jgi:hypothetical protein